MQGARGEDQGGPAQAGGAGAGSASEPYVRGDLTIDYPQRRVTMAGRPVALTGIEYRMLVELSVNAGRALTHERLLQTGLGTGQGRRLRAGEKHRQEAAPQAGRRRRQPEYILTEPSVGYRMPEGEEEAKP